MKKCLIEIVFPFGDISKKIEQPIHEVLKWKNKVFFDNFLISPH